MSIAELIQVLLMAFVLLAPTLMVAVLVSGLSRRADDPADPVEAFETFETFEVAEPVGVSR
ncbi:hypothetical protein [Nocardioides sp.]|uniref:hypothetical protein n=1 Tax=Nocardioides sp. TaxID=35761 RepID=UPI0037840526